MLLRWLEPGFDQHVVELVKSVGVARRSRGQHDEAETGRVWRGHPIGIRDELDDRNAAARPKRALRPLQESDAGWRVEVMQEIRD